MKLKPKIRENQWGKSWFLKKSNEVEKPLAKFTKEKKIERENTNYQYQERGMGCDYKPWRYQKNKKGMLQTALHTYIRLLRWNGSWKTQTTIIHRTINY